MTHDPKTPTDYQALAELLYPNITQTPADLLKQYPLRQLPAGAYVTRFAPSPTGFIHIGGISTALVARTLAHQSGGIFILRIEDTDQNRQLERGVEEIVEALAAVNLLPDEGPYSTNPLIERGEYGPYEQSKRLHLYAVFAKDLVARGIIYPCFMTPHDLEGIQEAQRSANAMPGIYGEWAKSRILSLDEIRAKLANGESFVIRYKATYPNDTKISLPDVIRGDLEMPTNDKDMVLIKSDGFPTYHFAHPVDDMLMGVNVIIRGEEWLPSAPLHLDLYRAITEPLGLKVPPYAHVGLIAKMDDNSKRKLSKRKDPEAAMAYYYKEGYPIDAVIEYLLNLANSNFEEWRIANPDTPFGEFKLAVEKMGKTMPLFDIDKLKSIGKDVIARLSAEDLYQQASAWARQYDPVLAELLTANPAYTTAALNIERDNEPPRKDLAKWSDIYEFRGYFFDALYEQALADVYATMPQLAEADLVELLGYFSASVETMLAQSKEDWVAGLREYAAANNFAAKAQEVKKNPGIYKGWFGDMMMVLRVALCGKTYTPDLYLIMQTMGAERIVQRLNRVQTYYQRT